MHLDYARVSSVGIEAFNAMRVKHRINEYTKSDPSDLQKIERLLEARDGLFKNENFYVKRSTCNCGHTLTFFDFIYTALKDAGHTKSFVLHTLVGSKFVINQARPLRCSECDTLSEPLDYITPQYCCCRDDGISPVDDDSIAGEIGEAKL